MSTDLGMPPVLDAADADRSVLLAAPRGYCAGVDRAVITVEKALDLYGAPVYVRKQIVHNKHVVADLESRGAVFVEEIAEVPEGATVVFSAHGVSPEVHRQAEERSLKTIDATCPLVTKVHHEARRFAKEDYDILLIGHAGHEEVEGTAGEAPEHIRLVQTPEDVAHIEVRDPAKVAWLSQTTLSVDETMTIVDAIRERHQVELGHELHRYHLLKALPPESEQKLKELRAQVEKMGEINLTAIDEHQEVAGRFEFLSAQKKDLEASLDAWARAFDGATEPTLVSDLDSTRRYRESRDVCADFGVEETAALSAWVRDRGVTLNTVVQGMSFNSSSE